jgi:hypothetical protein
MGQTLDLLTPQSTTEPEATNSSGGVPTAEAEPTTERHSDSISKPVYVNQDAIPIDSRVCGVNRTPTRKGQQRGLSRL